MKHKGRPVRTGLPKSGNLTRNREPSPAFAPRWLPALEHEAHPCASFRLCRSAFARTFKSTTSQGWLAALASHGDPFSASTLRRFDGGRFLGGAGDAAGQCFHFRFGQPAGRALASSVVSEARTGRNQAANYNVLL